MSSVNIAELKNRLSTYVTFARGGEEIIIRDRNLPVAKLIPFSAGDAGERGTVARRSWQNASSRGSSRRRRALEN